MEKETPNASNNTVYYVIGAVVLIAVLIGAYMYMPKPSTPSESPLSESKTAPPEQELGMISKLKCDTQYYNPVIGFEKYYISTEGSDTTDASEVTCTTTVTQENKVVAKEILSVPLTENKKRGGVVFKCSTPALELKSTIPTKVDVMVVDDKGDKATCSALFALPKP